TGAPAPDRGPRTTPYVLALLAIAQEESRWPRRPARRSAWREQTLSHIPGASRLPRSAIAYCKPPGVNYLCSDPRGLPGDIQWPEDGAHRKVGRGFGWKRPGLPLDFVFGRDSQLGKERSPKICLFSVSARFHCRIGRFCFTQGAMALHDQLGRQITDLRISV